MKNIVEVIIDIGSSALNQTFYYHVPESLQQEIEIGHAVLVPLRNRTQVGYVVGYVEQTTMNNMKDIKEILGERPWFDADMLDLARWMEQYYMCSLMDALNSILPTGIKNRVKKTELLPPKVQVRYEKWACLKITSDKMAELLPSLVHRAPKQATMLSILQHEKEMPVRLLLKQAATTHSTLTALNQKGCIEIKEKEFRRDPFTAIQVEPDSPMSPTVEQHLALEKIDKEWKQKQKHPLLLHGVTGSGKTEIYLQTINQVIKEGKQAIVLVPEISLTPQMVKRFKARFGNDVAVLHSGLSLGERYDEWRRIKENKVKIVVGARSAIFAPFKKLGLIIIDEEHENTYKQSCHPRYHAREVAIRRSMKEDALVILGSATPSLESYQKALKGEYLLVEMKKRIDGRALPPVKLVDLREEIKKGNKSILSYSLQQAINERLEKQEQIILFLNRRGFSTFVLCRECGLVLRCHHCDVSLTYHADHHKMHCHFCDHQESVPDRCPSCQSPYIKYFGIGTQKVEEVVKSTFPEARVLRMDMDTTSRKGDHERLLSAFEHHEADILIGTQMIAKGLDFGNVTLVGVISADTSLHLADFRAGERTFQLMTQVAGRAGRGTLGGEVIVQTYSPQHYSLIAAEHHNYQAFYEDEIKARQELDYPPFSHIIRLLITSIQEKQTIQGAETLGNHLQIFANERGCHVLGPVQAPISKIKNAYRWHIILKGENMMALQDTVHQALAAFKSAARTLHVDIHIDVDPLSML